MTGIIVGVVMTLGMIGLGVSILVAAIAAGVIFAARYRSLRQRPTVGRYVTVGDLISTGLSTVVLLAAFCVLAWYFPEFAGRLMN